MAPESTVELGIEGLTGAELIGTGGFAVVYKAEQPAFRRTVAVKLLTVGRLDDETSHRFERECQVMGSLSEHPSIVTIFDAGFTKEDRPYLLMSFMPGGSIEDRIAASGPMQWREAVPICVRMAGALEVAHRSDIVHRDVKPDNILLSSFGEPQLTDFGIARIAGGPETRSGVITASMAHAAPEVIDGDRPSVAADVYSLGSTLYTLLAGEPAFTRAADESVFPMLLRIRSDPVPDLRERGVPSSVCSAVEAAMEKDPANRPRTAVEFGRLLREAEEQSGLAPTSMLLGFDAKTEQPASVEETIVVATAPQVREATSEPEAPELEPPEPEAAGPEPAGPEPGALELEPAEPEPEIPEPAATEPEPAASAPGDSTVLVPDTSPERRDTEPAAPIDIEPARRRRDPRRPRWLVPALAVVLAAALAGTVLVLVSRDGESDGGLTAGGDPSLAEQGRLTPGSELEGFLGEQEVHRFTFDGQEGIVAGVEMRAAVEETDPFVRVFAPDGREIAADDDLGGGLAGLDALALFLMPVDGPYVIEASDISGSGGEYVIGLTFEAATLLERPVVAEEALEFSASDRDLYVVTARAGEVIDVVMAADQPGLDPFLVVYGPGDELGSDDDSGGGIQGLDARVVITAPVDGSYRILAGHADATGGRYRLEVTGYLSIPAQVEGHLGPFPDRWILEAAGDRPLVFTLEPLDAEFEADLLVTDDNDLLPGSGSGGGVEGPIRHFIADPPPSGLVHAVVIPQIGEGRYRLTVEEAPQ